MMTTATNSLAARIARDRIIEVLWLGRTYPLHDLQVVYPPTADAGSPVTIVIKSAQRGVTYQLCDEDGNPILVAGEPIVGTAREDGDDVELVTPPLHTDAQFTILATRKAKPLKTGAAVGGQPEPAPDLETYLSHVVSIEVTGQVTPPHPEPCPVVEEEIMAPPPPPAGPLSVSVDTPIADYNATATFTVTGNQAATEYHLFQRQLIRADYVTAQTSGRLEVPTGDGASVFIKAPGPIADWANPPGFSLVGIFAGNTLTAAHLTGDTIFLVRATTGGTHSQAGSTIVVLVRPNHQSPVSVQQSPIASNTQGRVIVGGTQSGVVYQLRLDPNNTPVGKPGYHHADRGIEFERAEVDLVVGLQQADGAGDALWLPTQPLPTTSSFNILATKLVTGLTAQLTNKATIQIAGGEAHSALPNQISIDLDLF